MYGRVFGARTYDRATGTANRRRGFDGGSVKNFKRILAGLDLGREGDAPTLGSRRALKRAVWIADRVGASLTLLHSKKPDEYWDPRVGGFVAGRGQVERRQRALDAVVAELEQAGTKARLVMRSDSAWMAIVQEVIREGIDLVVVGKRTDVQTDERKLGTVARRLLDKCPCAVWLEDPRASGDPTIILAAVDMTAVGDRVIDLAATVAHALGAELHIVHAFSITLEAQLQGGEAREAFERDTRKAAVAHIEKALAATPLAGAAVLHVGPTSPTQAILEGVERLAPQLVVMGTISRGGIPGLLMGNTAERLIDRIDCALLAVKPDDFVCPVEC